MTEFPPLRSAAACTDLTGHHIEGFIGFGRNTDIKVPLISEILPGFWTGGCIGGVRLPDDFGFVLSLYPWERYRLGPDTSRLEVRLYDSAEIPNPRQLHELAELVNVERREHKVLVHCQAGLNRSGLVAGLALVLDGMTPVDAIALMREKRSRYVLVNSAFEEWLLGREQVPTIDLPKAA